MTNKFLFTQKQEILEHCARIGVTVDGLSFTAGAIDAASRRACDGGLKSFGIDYASAINGATVQADSWTVELKYLLSTIIEKDNRLCIDQPGKVMVNGKAKSGRRTRFRHTPDYLDINAGYVALVECKSEKELIELVTERPNDYVKEGDRYRFIPAEDCAKKFGMRSYVFMDSSVSKTFLANLMLICPLQVRTLDDSTRNDILQIQRLVATKPKSIAQIRKQQGLADEIPILTGLANGMLFGCLRSTRLTQESESSIFATAEPARQEDSLREELLSAQKRMEDTLWNDSAVRLRASDLRHAVARMKRITEIANGTAKANSNDRKIALAYAEGLAKGEEPEKAAATNFERSGNRGSRIEDQTPLMEEFYRKHIAIPNPKSKWETYRLLLKGWEKASIDHVSYETWRKFVVAKGDQRTALAQAGSRGFQSKTPITDQNEKRPLALTAGQIVHVDASPEDCRCFAEIAGVLRLERPCFALAVCEKFQLVLGFAVAFGSASRFLLALLLRDIVRRWGFFPPWIVNDGGPENRSNMWRTALAWNRTSVISRPTAAARAGVFVESAIRHVNYGVLRKLSGSTRNDEARRSASNKTKSRATAVHHFGLMQGLVREYVEHHAPHMPKGFAEGTPLQLFEQDRRLRPVGLRASLDQPMTLVETSVPIAVRQRQLDPTRGLRVGIRSYSSAELIEAAARNNKRFDEVRVDPEDPSIVYVNFPDGWVRADAHDSSDLRLLSSTERLVEGMHASSRWDDNREDRAEETVRLNNKLDELEARAAAVGPSVPKVVVPNSTTKQKAELFAKYSTSPSKGFPTREKGK